MATLKRITPNPPLSALSRVAPDGGAGVWAGIADALGAAADHFMPGARLDMEQRGMEAGMAAAGQGGTSIDYLRAPGSFQSPTSLTGDLAYYAEGIAAVESRGSGDYGALGPVTGTGDRAYGRYQVMGSNVGNWTEKYLGRRMTPEEFLRNPQAQDAVFAGEFGSYIEKYGNPYDAASVWFTGRPQSEGGDASDGYITGNEYVGRFDAALKAIPRETVGEGRVSGQSVGVVFNVPDDRHPREELTTIASQAVHAVVGPEWQIEVGSGFRPGDPRQHGKRNAMDFAVVNTRTGERLRWDDPRTKQIAQEFTARGGTGVGAGPNYMGGQTFHFDIRDGGISVWSDDPNPGGPGAAEWYDDLVASAQGAPIIPGTTAQAPIMTSPQAVAITSEGKMQPMLFSPFSGPLLQTYNAAALAAYTGEVQNRATRDLLEMSFQFPLDPQGFEGASQAYIDQIVADAPASARASLRSDLSTMAMRRVTGLMAERQSDIEARARNAVGARVEALSGEYAQLLAAGDADGARGVGMQLQEVLSVRERLPGANWTPEQSANVFTRAEAAADSILADQQRQYAGEVKDSFETIIDARKAGMTAQQEGLLSDPRARAAQPELAAEAAAYVALTDRFPDLFSLPPDQQRAMVADLKANPVSTEWQVDLAKFAETAVTENIADMNDDLVARSRDVFPAGMQPPDLALPGPDGTGDFVESLKRRAEWGEGMWVAGYSDQPQMLSNAEITAISGLFDQQLPSEVRVAAAAALAEGLGDYAPLVFDQLSVDKTTRASGKLLSVGGDPTTVSLAMRGEEMLRNGVVSAPSTEKLTEAMGAGMISAFDGLYGSGDALGDILPMARSIYAARYGGKTISDTEEKAAMQEAVQLALGMKTDNRGVTGGIQDILGFPTLLPVGVKGDEAADAIDRALKASAPAGFFAEAWRSVARLGGAEIDDTDEAWRAATSFYGDSQMGSYTGSGPMLGGQPLSYEVVGRTLRTVPMGGSKYRLEIVTPEGATPVEDTRGLPFVFDLEELIEATR